MNKNELIIELFNRKVKLWVEGDQLRIRAPKGVLTQDLLDAVTTHKADVIELLRQNTISGDDSHLPIIKASPEQYYQPFPLTDIQQAYWLGRSSTFELGNVATHAYIEIDGDNLDIKLFTEAWQKLILRHDMLRAVVLSSGEQQILEMVPPYDIEVLDLQEFEPEAAVAKCEEIREQMSHQVLPPDKWPLFEIRATRLDQKRYRLHVSFDLLMADLGSLQQLLRELNQLYHNPETQLPPLELSFRDYVLAERHVKETQLYQQAQSYWWNRLDTLPLAPELSLAKSVLKQPRFLRRSAQLDQQKWQQLKQRAQAMGLTPSGVLLAAFAEVLTVWSKSPKFTINLTLFNRLPLHPQVNEIVGDFTSVTLLEVNNSTSETFRIRALRIQQQLWQDLDHRYVSGVEVMRELARRQGGTHRVMMPVVFTSALTHNFLTNTTNGLNQLGEIVYGISQTPQVWLDHQVSEQEERLMFNWDVVADLFPEGMIDDMFETYCQLLLELATKEAVWQQPKRQLVPAYQLEQRAAVNQTSAPDSGELLHTLFAKQAKLRKHSPAVISPERVLTYEELWRLANQVGHRLQQLGAKPNSLVAVVMSKGWEQVVAVLGVLMSGAAYVPIDPQLPSQRQQQLLEQSQACLIVTNHPLVATSAWVGLIPVVVIDERMQSQEPIPPLAWVQTPEDLAYVIYTSGSTGIPKGVAIDHCGAVNTLLDINSRFCVSPADRVLALSALNFDLSVYDIFGVLAAGGAIVMPTATEVKEPGHWVELMRQHHVTLWNTVPALGQMLADYLSRERMTPPPDLRLALLSGDWLPLGLPAQLRQLWSQMEIVSLGGATEASIWSICYPIDEVDPSWSSIPYGKPLVNQTFAVLDDRLNARSVWVPGELYIGGIGLARGYWQDEERTATSFITHPVTGERLYKTGDLGRYLPDGNIEFLGRIDHQIKIRGFRIELGEIESMLGQHPTVQQTVVTTVGESANRQLVAYVVPTTEHYPTSSSEADDPIEFKLSQPGWQQIRIDHLREFLQEQLPAYMMPSYFVILDALPLTPNGKVDRKALPAPEMRSEQKLEFEAGRTPIEEMLTLIWADILKVEQIGIHDNFFELGGNSLLATQAIAQVRSTISVEIPLRSLFEHPTVAESAQIIQLAIQPEQQLTAPPLRPIARDRELPLSFAQARLWFLDQLQPHSAFYNIPVVLRLVGKLDVVALQESINEIIRRHEALRTNFIATDGIPVQVIAATRNLTLEVIDLQSLPEAARELETTRLATELAQQPFDLAQEPLVRAKLMQVHQTEYVLLLTMHHIISDGWSTGVFVRELVALYTAFSNGQPSPLPKLPIQYADFAAWQRQWLQSEVLESQLTYWQQKLAGAPTLLALPTDRLRPAFQSFRGAHQQIAIPVELSQALRLLSRQQGVTLFMTLLAAFDTLLYRYTSSDDICVGTPVANRQHKEIEGLIGFFVNTLVMRTDLSGNPSFAELLSRVRSVALEAYTHQDIPFEQLVEALQPDRSLSHTPLFQVMFDLQNVPMSALDMTGLSMSSLTVETNTTKFDLTLSILETDLGLVGVWEYSTDLFDTATITRMAGHFQLLLSGIVANPQQQLSELPLLSKPERQQLLVEWNDTKVDYPFDKCIHQLFEEQVARTPDAVAVVFENRQLTYRQLNNRANQLAHYLQSLGVVPEVLVGICIERSIEMVVGLLGILKAGGAYVPLDPGYPSERLSYTLSDAQISVLLTQQQLVEKLPEHQAQVVYLDQNWDAIPTSDYAYAQFPKDNFYSQVQPTNLAYVLYTSGSTGKPKGVAIEHRSPVALVAWAKEAFTPEQLAGVLASTSICFDLSVFELFVPLSWGRKVILAENALHLPTLPAAEQVTLINTVPSAITELIRMNGLPGGVSTVNLAGEPLQNQLVQQIYQQQTVKYIFNLYGPSEDTTYSSFALIEKGATFAPSIGRAIANTQIYILDEYLQPVPVGVTGELHIGGAGLARGYLNRPQLTTEKFIPNPFSNAPHSRLYKTGDLARYLPDGNIEYLGRIDNQVKIRGFRIELGEIETVLSQLGNVQASCVIAREDIPGDKRLVAYVVCNQQSASTTSELRQYLKEKLPEYMVPGIFVFLETLPLTANGKVDRRALPNPELQLTLEGNFVTPQTPSQEILAGIWAEVLAVKQVGIYDNFFELGGHSLLATQLVSRIRNIFKVELPLRSLFAKATVAELAQEIGQLQQQNLELTSSPILPRVYNAELPLSFAQQRLWFLDQLEPNSALYNIPLALRILGTLSVKVLEQSLEEIIHRHEALCTNFITIEGKPSQIIQTQTNWIVSVVEYQHLSTSEQEFATQQLAQQQTIQPFDLASEVLVRATLVILSETEHILLVCMHHIVSDGWSIGVFLQELAALYNAYSQGQPSRLASLPIQYADFAIWQHNWLQGDVLQSQLNYWQQQLKDAPALLVLPTDRPRPAVQTFAGAHQKFALSEKLTQGLIQLSQEQGVTLFMTLLAAYDTFLYRYTGQSDILVGSPIANRDRSEIEGLIGFFVNTLVMRTNLTGNPTFSELLTRVREMSMDAYAHQNLPFEMLVEALQPQRDLSHTPLFQVMFALQNAPMSEVELTGLSVSPLVVESTTAKFDLTLSMQNTADGLVGVWEYSTDLFDAATITRMAGHFQLLLSGIVANPQQQLSELPLLSKPERQQLLVEWNDTKVDYPFDKCIHQLFEEQVARTPDAVAVVFENRQLTYRQLNNRANQLAHYLQSLGVVPEVLVGICIERSIEMVVGLLGILKAGGAYVPLDPGYPSERLSYTLSDAQISVLLTQQQLVEKLPEHQAQVVYLDQNWDAIPTSDYAYAQFPKDNFYSQVQPTNLAYVLYTSGSTGKPKGVAIEHRSPVALVAWAKEAFTPEQLAGVLASTSICFDLSVFELFVPLSWGRKVILAENALHLPTLPAAEQVTLINTVPSAITELIRMNGLPGGVSTVNLAGEPLQNQLVQQIYQQQTVKYIFNLYGPSEDTTYSSFALIEKGATFAPSIGRAIANTQIYILDEYLQPVPVGVTGELHIGGAGLARGYLNRPQLTTEKFIPNPFSNAPHSRLYKTGDLARYLPDGNIEYLGRIDNQVKIRGFRIELGEIEAVLSQLGNVQASCVIAREDIPGDKRLVAYVVCNQQSASTTSELRQYLKEKLPEYMVPGIFVFLETLPLTANGKVDRRALPNPELQLTLEGNFVTPQTPSQEILAGIWAEVLAVKQVGIYDNFFELGGHSLLATQLVSRIRNIFKVELPLRSLFAKATVAELAQEIGQLQQQNLELTSSPILPRVYNAELPLSFAQQRLWFLDQLEPNSALYNIPLALRILGTLSVKALEQSLEEIIHRHEALCTNFITIEGKPSQIIQTQTNWIVSIVDLTHLSITEQEIATQQLAQQQAIQPFNLASEVLVRAKLLVLSQTEHALLVCMHHIVSDGWSMGVFVQELASLYNNYSQFQPSTLTPLSIQYADFAIWQREWLQGDVLQSQLNYWQQQLKDAPALLSLPIDRPRPSVQTFSGAYQEFAISSELTNGLTQLSQEQGVTLFMTLLAAFDTLLYRYTGQSDILVGSPIANRDRSEIEGLIGFFVNTLVMRSNLAGNPSFSELLFRVRDMAMDAYAHQHLPFEMLLEALQPERDLSHTPLFQVIFALQNASISELDLTGLTVNQLKVEGTTAKFDLTLSIQNTSTGLMGVWEYNTDLFDASTIERMTGHFVILLASIITNPEQLISQLPLLTQTEQQQLLVEWNDTGMDYPQDLCIHQLFEQQVERTPNAVAVVYENQQLTYQELNCRANQLAHYLRSLDIGADVLVGLCIERSLEIIVALLGILKAGGAYLPLDPEYPQERLSFILENAQVPLLLTQQSLLNRLPENTARCVCLDTDWHLIGKFSQDNAITDVQATNLAYVIYTSGSTGQPKGVEVVHRGVNRLLFGANYVNLDATQTFLQLAPISFDASTFEIWGALLHGARCVLFPESIPSSQNLGDEIRKHGITVLWLTAALFNCIIDDNSQALSGIKQLLIGGEALSVTHVQRALANLPFTQIINGYGPTESTTFTCCHPISRQIDATIESIPIGRPIANTQVYILDKYLQPVPVGIPGELHIGGAGLARGYLNRNELTQEKFILNPFRRSRGVEEKLQQSFASAHNPLCLSASSERLYKTGDLARYLSDGNIEYIGRIDNQVKIRGFRIELGEIKTVLSQYPHVQASCVIAREEIPGDKRLVAYVVPQKEQTLTVGELRSFLKEKLPEYMMPSAIVILKALPLTPNGKLDRRALPAPDLHSQLSDKYVAPRNPIEEILSLIWAQVLKVEQVGIHDNFFELGGHSLLATQLVSRVRTSLKVELPLRSLFAAPTVAELSQNIQRSQQQDLELTASAILPRARDAELPLSFAQQRLWFLDQLEPNSALYNIPIALRLVGTLNQAALEQSLQEIIHRHEALHTNFITIDGQPAQVIQTETNWTVCVVDLTDLPTLVLSEAVGAASASAEVTEQEIALQQLAQQQATQPFDLAKGVLVRATLVMLSEKENALLVCIHHIIFDGWSMSVFVQELAALYNAYSQGQPSPLAPLPIQYADFAIWQRQWLQGNVLQSQLSYWQQQLANTPALLSLPIDRPRPAVQTFAGSHQEFVLSVELTDSLVKLSQEQGCTLFMTLLAAYDTFLYRYTGQSDILVGSPIANRDRSEIEGLIGFFVNTLVMRTNLTGNPTFSELLTRVREMSMDAYAHQNLPFEMLVEALQPQRDLSHTPLFQVMFALQNAPMSEVELTGLSVSPLVVESTTAKFDLTLSMQNTADGLVGVWEYSTDLFDAATITRMAGHFQLLLSGIVANPQQQLSELPLLSKPERQQLLVEWNDTKVDYPFDKCIHQLFEEQVARTPDAVAVVFENRQLTYRQLNNRANQLAHYLQSLGVVPEVLVGICIERSIEMVVGLLGILKAGGAYVPLDPGYPSERLSYTLSDAQISVLLTQQQLVEKLPEHQAQVVYLDQNWDAIPTSDYAYAQFPKDNFYSQVQPTNLAYVLYTSGSTGKPKGVAIEHRSPVALVAWAKEAFTPEQLAGVLASTSICFDLSVFELFVPLSWGRKVILAENALHLPTLPAAEQVTLINTVPSAITELIRMNGLPGGVSTVNLAGEPLQNQLVQQIYQQQTVKYIFNLYGPSEDTTYSSFALIEKGATFAPSIGRAIANTQIYILDEYLQPVPVGVTGELHIGGAGLARGYLNRPQLTTEKFIPNPFSNAPHSRLYKTGDLARYLPDGNIEYLGRIDNQVKIRGFRIELGEIEAVLSQLGNVQASCVIAREDIPGDKRLVAYVVCNQQSDPTDKVLRQFLKQQIPEYMMPSHFVILKALPLTPNGKVDRFALPAPHNVQRQNNFVPPRDFVELQLTQIWENILSINPISVLDNFFDLGSHSLLAVRLMAQIHKRFGQSLPLSTLFQNATIEQLSNIIRQQVSSSSWSHLVAIQTSGSKKPFFCVHPAGGNVVSYLNLARYLGEEQPFYGLQAQGLDGEHTPITSIEEMATSYIEAMRLVQKEGPYLVGGWSLGGTIAFEMAIQLQKQGHQVALLALFDSQAPNIESQKDFDDTVLLNNFAHVIGVYFGKNLVECDDEFKELTFNQQLHHILERAKMAGLMPTDAGIEYLRPLAEVFKTNLQAAQNYVPQIYLNQVILFKASAALSSDRPDSAWGWEKLTVKPVEIYTVAGEHLTMMSNPYVQDLADKLRGCLNEAQTF